jgi:hypothetical protein
MEFWARRLPALQTLVVNHFVGKVTGAAGLPATNVQVELVPMRQQKSTAILLWPKPGRGSWHLPSVQVSRVVL